MKFRKAEVVCTGSELLSSRVNLYVPAFAQRLIRAGFRIQREHCVGDSRGDIKATVAGALRCADLVMICGGLGPTFDDVTREAVAQALGRKLVYSEYAEKTLMANYKLTDLAPNMKNQCYIIEGAVMADNANGTAFGLLLKQGRKMLALLPGPAKEWEPMFDGPVLDGIKKFFKVKEGAVRSLNLKIADLGEVKTENLLKPVMARFRDAAYTILAGANLAEFSVTVCGKTAKEAAGKLARIEKACRKALGGNVYGINGDTPGSVAGGLLFKKGKTLSLAESCTGGLAASLITDVAGSSDYFSGGAVTYSNAAKEKLLGVKKATLLKYGAVSKECALEMAAGCRRLFKTDYAVAITGIAGPLGGTETKPVGLVHFAVAEAGKISHYAKNFRGPRTIIKNCAANFALEALRRALKN
ncbi:MAG TPA: CinA family nicotinamide mononucleotide deamidase-related protein [Elusimicrobiales bacterium]|nr:CinA family nicotinamide mononucleotide deamidase-related protein [Elusimicrobiales bacterium]